jgi:hypothetical protein
MPNANSENTSLWIKVGLYIMGSILGIGAKLATMQRVKPIKMTDAIIELSIASAASFLVWSFFHFKLKEDDLAIVASVIVGRYGDNILIAAFNKIEKMINKVGEK